ncbi:Mcm10 [Trypoxylus dichotomus]
MKAMLPRRESERRTHPLARHCDILSAVETRISMLNMTFSKYIDTNLCCFIPGKVVDEIERVLRIIQNKAPPPRTHELLQELRDISSMAMEYFEEQILPNLKLQMEQPPIIPLLPPTSSKGSKYVLVDCSLAEDVCNMRKQNRQQKMQFAMFTTQLNKIEKKVKRQGVKLKTQAINIHEQERKIQEQTSKIQEQETTIADLRKHIDEWEQKFADLTVEVRVKDDHKSKTSHASQMVSNLLPAPSKFHLPNIKPRKAQVLPKAISVIHAELERKRKSSSPFEVPTKILRSMSSGDQRANIHYSTVGLRSAKDDRRQQQEGEGPAPAPLSKSKSDIGTFTSGVIGTLLSNPITCIKSRKRKIEEIIELE